MQLAHSLILLAQAGDAPSSPSLHWTDVTVLVGYFVMMIMIGVICSRYIKKQDDFFMGGRGFGKLLQTFAAFGAGTSANDPIQTGRTVWTSGLSGIWSVLMWLFVTPFYWIFGVWYRRMRHLTLGDWFVERYESRTMGVAYTIFGFSFCIVYLSSAFSAIGKVAASMLGPQTMQWLGIAGDENLKFYLLPTIAVVVLIYGVLGGIAAAYWTDLIQGSCIILLSVILIPTGLSWMVSQYGDPSSMTWVDGFRIMHDRVPADYFHIFGGPHAGEFPIHYIISLTLLGLVGIVVQPHFIATGGGTAKTEMSARMGLVTGNFLKRFCTIGWALTGLILLGVMASNLQVNEDPDYAWGLATVQFLGPLKMGLVGLMLACLLAALMSSADCYMIVTSALVVRNIYVPYVDPEASEKSCITVGRLASFIVIIGAMAVSLWMYDVFAQFKLALEVTLVFAAPFWIGMFWRRATKWAAWLTMLFSFIVFFVIPVAAPMMFEDLRNDQSYAITNHRIKIVRERVATESDVERRNARIQAWDKASQRLESAQEAFQAADRGLISEDWQDVSDLPNSARLARLEETLVELQKAQAAMKKLGSRPAELKLDEKYIDESIVLGGKSIFWSSGVQPIDEQGQPLADVKYQTVTEPNDKGEVRMQYPSGTRLQGQGLFNVDLYLYHAVGIDLTAMSNAWLETLRLPPRLITPFLLMILLSLITPRNKKESLDRYYAKMKTPVDPDPAEDVKQLEASNADPSRFDNKRLFPSWTGLEIQKPTVADILGFAISVGICVLFVLIAYWVANIGA